MKNSFYSSLVYRHLSISLILNDAGVVKKHIHVTDIYYRQDLRTGYGDRRDVVGI